MELIAVIPYSGQKNRSSSGDVLGRKSSLGRIDSSGGGNSLENIK